MTTALDIILGEYFRPYQVQFLRDWSPRRLVLKARRVGLSDVAAFDVVMTTSGLWEALGAPVVTHNYSVISKRDIEAQQFIRYCQRWIGVLSEDPITAPYVELAVDSKTALTFKRSGRRIQSDTQSVMAGRGQEGHLLKDEAAWYPYAREIVAGADKIPLSDPRLRLTEFSTPNGTSGMGEVFWRKWMEFDDYSRHEIDIYRAVADGFPITPEEARKSCFTDEEFQQEFCCKFVAGAAEYFSREMVEGAVSSVPARRPDRVILGIDVASLHDLTAIAVLEQYGDATWLRDSYLVSGVPYATGAGIGQEDIVAALLWALKPDVAIIDASADGAELYGRLIGKGIRGLVPHSFHSGGRQWKAREVPRLRQDLEEGRLQFGQLAPRVFVAGGPLPTPTSAPQWVDTQFRRHHFEAVLHDFLKIERKLLQTGVTFDAPRSSSEGHADLFWAIAMAYSVVERVNPLQGTRPALSALLEGTGSFVSGADYGDFI